MKLKDLIKQLPSNVSGDGKNFVSGLKRILGYIQENGVEGSAGESSKMEQVTGLQLTEEHATNSSGNINNIRVTFDTTNVTDYFNAQIWLKEDGGSWSQVGTTGGIAYLIENVKSGTTYFVKVVATNRSAVTALFDEAPQASIKIKGSVLLCATPEQFYWSNERKRWEWSGYEDNSYTDFFEIRLDQYAGVWNENRLDAVPYDGTTFYSDIAPNNRIGTAYLYVRNVFGQYNTPAVHNYSITAPAKPLPVEYECTLNGVVLTFQALPSGCIGYKVEVTNGEATTEFDINTQQWTYFQFSGSLEVRYAFVDSLGMGEYSNSVTITVVSGIKAEWLNEASFVASELNASTTAALMNALGAVPNAKLGEYYTKTETDEAISSQFASFDTSGQLTNYYTKNETANYVNSQLTSYATTSALTSAIEQTASSINSVVAKYTKGGDSLIPIETVNGWLSGSVGSVPITNTSNYYWIAWFKVEPNTSYYVTTQLTKRDSGNRYLVRYFDTDKKYLGATQGKNGFLNETTSSVMYEVATDIITTNANTEYITVEGRPSTNTNLQAAEAFIKVKKASLDVNYSAITQLSDGISLTVSGASGTSSINLTQRTLSLNTNLLTIGNSNSLVTITDGAVTADKLAANSVTAAKIASNAVTADKINAGAVTTAKLSANAVTAEKINAGAVTTAKLSANAVTADKIAANSVQAKHLYGETITLSNALAIVGGAVRLDDAGLHCNMANGSTINFNTNGMSVQDSNGRTFSQIARFATGVVAHGETVNLNWDIAPRTVLMLPYSVQCMVSGYTSSDLYIKCFASNITAQGFKANCYTTIASGSYSRQVVRDISSLASTNPPDNTWRTFNVRTPFVETLTLPVGAAQATYQGDMYWYGYIHQDYGLQVNYINFEVYLDDQLAYSYQLQGSMRGKLRETAIKKSISYSFNTNGKRSVKFAMLTNVQTRREVADAGYDEITQELTNGVLIANVTGDAVISQGSATYFAIG